MDRLRVRARAEAQVEAKRQLAAEWKEVEAADGILVQLAEMLPPELRKSVAETRRKLSAKIFAHQRTKGQVSPDEAGQTSLEADLKLME